MVTLEELERRIQIQEDIRAIEHLQADYWDCLDQKDWVGLRACFTDDFVFMNKTTGGRYEGGDGMVETMKGKFTEQVTSSHHGHHHWVEITGEATAIGGSRFGNREGLLPKEQGRTYTECDIDTVGENSRGAKRIVFSNDGLVYYTDDHYESFELLYGEP